MSTTLDVPRTPRLLVPVAWVGRSVILGASYVGGIVLLACSAAGAVFWANPVRAESSEGFRRTVVRQLAWMLAYGIPLVGLVHIAMGSFLSLQAYYGSTFVDGTGAVVGVGLLRNLGGLMTGMILSGILAARLIPELSRPARCTDAYPSPTRLESGPPIRLGSVAAPRIAAAALACVVLSQWGIAVGTLVGWQASESMMGLPTETFFLMMVRMVWFRDVVGLIVKGVLFGALAASVCCFEAFREAARPTEIDAGDLPAQGAAGMPLAAPILRATCLGIVAILIVNLSWFILVYHAVPFYGPTLLKPPVF